MASLNPSKYSSFSISAAFLFFTLFVTQTSFAMSFCLYARSNSNPTSGHAFVTVEDNRGQIIESYGYWPKETYPHNLTINVPADNPLRVIKARWGLTKDQQNLSESRLCQQIGGITVEQIRKAVFSYPQKLGPYKYLTNNCTHFAVRMYNAVTKDSFPLVTTPSSARRAIKEVYVAGAKSYDEVRRARGR